MRPNPRAAGSWRRSRPPRHGHGPGRHDCRPALRAAPWRLGCTPARAHARRCRYCRRDGRRRRRRGRAARRRSSPPPSPPPSPRCALGLNLCGFWARAYRQGAARASRQCTLPDRARGQRDPRSRPYSGRKKACMYNAPAVQHPGRGRLNGHGKRGSAGRNRAVAAHAPGAPRPPACASRLFDLGDRVVLGDVPALPDL